MQRALFDLGEDAKPRRIQEHIKEKFGLDLPTTLISSYKSNLARKAADTSGVTPQRSRRPALADADEDQYFPSRGHTAGNLTVEDIREVKELAERIGADRLKELVEVLSH